MYINFLSPFNEKSIFLYRVLIKVDSGIWKTVFWSLFKYTFNDFTFMQKYMSYMVFILRMCRFPCCRGSKSRSFWTIFTGFWYLGYYWWKICVLLVNLFWKFQYEILCDLKTWIPMSNSKHYSFESQSNQIDSHNLSIYSFNSQKYQNVLLSQ